MKLRSVLFVMLAMTTISAQAVLPTPEDKSEMSQAAVQSLSKIDQKMNAFVVKKEATGAETLVLLKPGDGVSRGDVIEYQGLFTNQDKNRIRRMVATLTIPDGVELVGGVSPSIVKASLDGNRFATMPIRANLNGQVQELPLAYYRVLRWTIEDVGIGATAVVKYRVRVK